VTLVSIVVPTVGRPQLLSRALESVVAQTTADWEAIVVDEGGLDETRAVTESFSDSRIVLHRQANRVGIVENWGTGVRLAQGEFVCILADDDILGPSFLEERLVRLSGRPDLLVAFSRFKVRTEDGSLAGVTGGCREEAELDGEGLLRAALSRSWFTGTSLYRRLPVLELWPMLQHDGLVLDLGLDVRLALRAGAKGVALPITDFTMLAHASQSSVALLAQVRPATDEALARIERELGSDRRTRTIRKERARWLTTWARAEAAAGDLSTARRRLSRAVMLSPGSAWSWRQLGLSLVAPSRLVP
jgi:glycosyltransferase involved in cell wall biosynthesis